MCSSEQTPVSYTHIDGYKRQHTHTHAISFVCTILSGPHAPLAFLFFFFNDTATTEIYTLSLHDALPICAGGDDARVPRVRAGGGRRGGRRDRKSTRLNSSHQKISYAVFCLKKKKRG